MILHERALSLPEPSPDERRGTIGFAWPALLCVVTVLALAADYLGLPAGDTSTLLRAVFVIGMVFLAAALAGQWLAGDTRGDRLLWVSPLAVALALAVLWHYSGTLNNPAFTIFMAVPVILAGVASYRWLPFLVALVATAALVVTALVSHAEVRWFIERWGISWPEALTVGRVAGRAVNELPGLAIHPDAFFATFAAGMLATALGASAVGSLLERYRERYLQAAALGEESRQLANRLLASGTSPAAVIAPGSGTIITANDAFLARVGIDAAVGRSVLKLLSFSHEEALRRLLDGEEASFDQLQVVRSGGDGRLSRVRLTRLDLAREEVLKLTLDDPQPTDYLALAMDHFSVALIVIDGEQRVIAADPQAQAAFPGLVPGQAAAAALAMPDAPDWWQIAPRRRVMRTVRIGEREVEAEIVRHRPYGADQPLTFVAWRDAGGNR